LWLNPARDERFVASVDAALLGAPDRLGLQAVLRDAYPRAVVQESALSSPGLTWYVYRDGSWVDDVG
jgi:hypothetical protein